jgi:diacylglycerol kinase (ATP)
MTELTYEVPSKLKTMIGQLAYYIKGFEMLPRFQPVELIIRSEEMNMNEEVMMFLICNSNSVGGFEKLAPDASLQDGMLDVFILRKCNLAEFIRIVSAATRGEHLNDPHVVHFKTRRLEVTTSDYVQINLDGEFGGTLPCSFSVLPSHLQVFVDEYGLSSYK